MEGEEMILIISIFLMILLYGFVDGFHWWVIVLLILFGLCIIGVGRPTESKPVESDINSPENLAARQREKEHQSVEFMQRQEKERQQREALLDDVDIQNRRLRYLDRAINESRAKRRTGFNDAEWEVVKNAADFTARRDHARDGRRNKDA